MIPYPNIDPIALHIGPLIVRWYSLAYIAGILIGYRIVKKMPLPVKMKNPALFFDDLMLYAILGIVLGGRLGYVLVYRPEFYVENPLEALKVWHGGMSFHGGLAGILIAMWRLSKKYGTTFLSIVDRLALVTPIGLFFGRLANFINDELWGRPTDMPWGMVFPSGGPIPRHPSQLYQAGMEGLLLGLVLWWAYRRWGFTKIGLMGGIFMSGYAIARAVGECFREPDAQIGFLPGGITMGQVLCVPMLLVGVWLIKRSRVASRESQG